MNLRRIAQVGLYKWALVRARSHEWAPVQRVSMIDVPGLGRGLCRVLHAEGIEPADSFMAAESRDIADKLITRGFYSLEKRHKAIRKVEQWKSEQVRQWRKRVEGPIPPLWRSSDEDKVSS